MFASIVAVSVCVCASGCRLVCSLAVCFVCFNRVYYMPLCHWQGWAAGTGRGQITLKLLPQKLQRFLFINFNCFNKQQEPAAAAETGTNKVVKCFLAFFLFLPRDDWGRKGERKGKANVAKIFHSTRTYLSEFSLYATQTERQTDSLVRLNSLFRTQMNCKFFFFFLQIFVEIFHIITLSDKAYTLDP